MKSRPDRRIINRYLTALLLICLAPLIVAASVLAIENHPDYPVLPLEEMRIAIYTKAFAERFGLPDPVSGTEPSGGLEAIEFSIEKGRFAPYYYLNIYLYVDSSLPIKYPEEGVAGEKYMLISGTHFFGRSHEQWMKWSLQDRRHSTGLDGKYNRKASLATMDYIPGKRGGISDLSYIAFYREILPGLTYLKFNTPPPFPMLQSIQKNLGIWLQKESQTDYRSRFNIDPNDFLKLPIPDAVFKKVRDWSIQARDANSQIRILLREEKAQ